MYTYIYMLLLLLLWGGGKEVVGGLLGARAGWGVKMGVARASRGGLNIRIDNTRETYTFVRVFYNTKRIYIFSNFRQVNKTVSYLAFGALWLSVTDCPCFSHAARLRKTSVALICDGFMAELLFYVKMENRIFTT